MNRGFPILGIALCLLSIFVWGFTHNNYTLLEQFPNGNTYIVAKGGIGLLREIWIILFFPSLFLAWGIAVWQFHFNKFADREKLIRAEKVADLAEDNLNKVRQKTKKEIATANNNAANAYKIAKADTEAELAKDFQQIEKRETAAGLMIDQANKKTMAAQKIEQEAELEKKLMLNELKEAKNKTTHAWAAGERFKKQKNKAIAKLRAHGIE